MSTRVSNLPIILLSLKISTRYSERSCFLLYNFETRADATIIASVALFSLIATAHLPCCDLINSSVPIIMPPDSSPPNKSRGLIPRLIGFENTSSTTTSLSGLFFSFNSTFFIMFAISLKPTGTLTTLTS